MKSTKSIHIAARANTRTLWQVILIILVSIALGACGGGGGGAPLPSPPDTGLPQPDEGGGGNGGDPDDGGQEDGAQDEGGVPDGGGDGDDGPLGSVESDQDLEPQSRVFVLDAAEDLSEDLDTGVVIIRQPLRDYAAGDVLIGDDAHPFLRRVAAVEDYDGVLRLETTQASMSEAVESGSFSVRAHPDWFRALSDQQAVQGSRKIGPGGALALRNGLVLSPAGVLGVQDFTLFDLVVSDGNIDWARSRLMGMDAREELADEEEPPFRRVLASNGRVAAILREGTMSLAPSVEADFNWERGEGLWATSSMSLAFQFDFVVDVIMEGEVSLEMERDLVPTIRVPVTIPGPVPVYLEITLDIPIGFVLSAEAAGKATFEYRSNQTLGADLAWQSGGQLEVVPTRSGGSTQRTLSWDGGATVSAKLYLEPTVKVSLYRVVGPYFRLHPYVEAAVNLPLREGEKDLWVGLFGTAGLELTEPIFGRTLFDLQTDKLFEFREGWDLIRPQPGDDGPPAARNRAPVALDAHVDLPSEGGSVQLPAVDADGDTLTWSLERYPQHGVLRYLNKATGWLEYEPDEGFEGEDSILFSVADHEARSGVAQIEIHVEADAPALATLEVSVVSRGDSRPLAGASVSVTRIEDDQLMGLSRTDSDGRLLFEGLEIASYRVGASAEAHDAAAAVVGLVEADAGRTRNITLYLDLAEDEPEVELVATRINVSASPAKIELGQSVEIRGKLERAAFPYADLAGKILRLYADDKLITSGTSDANGIVRASYKPDRVGSVPIEARFDGDAGFKGSSDSGVLVVEQVEVVATRINVSSSPAKIELGQSVEIQGKLERAAFPYADLAGKILRLYADDKLIASGTSDANGIVRASYKPGRVGSIPIEARFDGDSGFKGSSSSASLSVALTVPKATRINLSLSPSTVEIGQQSLLKAKLEESALPYNDIAGKSVRMLVDGVVRWTGTTDANGVAQVYFEPKSARGYAIKAEFLGDAGYLASSDSETLKAEVPPKKGTKINLTLSPGTVELGQQSLLKAKLEQSALPYNDIAGKSVRMLVDGVVRWTGTTDANGDAQVYYKPASAGNYTIKAEFLGDSGYLASSDSETLKAEVPPKKGTRINLTLSPGTVELGQQSLLKAKLEESAFPYNDIAGKDVRILVDGTFLWHGTTDANGLVQVYYEPKSARSYTIKAEFLGDSGYLSSADTERLQASAPPKKATKINLTLSPGTVEVGQQSLLKAKLEESAFPYNDIAGKSVRILINGAVRWTGTTDANGIAQVYYKPASSGSYTVKAEFQGDSGYLASSDTGTLRANAIQKKATRINLTLSPSTVEVGEQSLLKAKLEQSAFPYSDIQGKSVRILINGAVRWSGTTDGNGLVQVNYEPPSAGSYTIKAEFQGDSGFLSSSDSETLKAEVPPKKGTKINLTLSPGTVDVGEKSLLKAKLEQSAFPYNDIQGKSVRILINGAVRWTGSTDGNGLVQVNYEPSSAGSYTIKAEFQGDSGYLASSDTGTLKANAIQKKATKIGLTISPGVMAAGERSLLKAKLEESSFPYYDLAEKTVAFYLNGSFLWSGTTDGNGIASVYLRSSVVGTKTIEARFDGDAAYYGASKKGTLTVTAAADNQKMRSAPRDGIPIVSESAPR